jgi:hypothetical protein
MRCHPSGYYRRNAVEYFMKGIGNRRKDVAGRLIGSQACCALTSSITSPQKLPKFLSMRPRSIWIGLWSFSATIAAVATAGSEGSQ